jgi:hypothetical protein
MAIVDEPPEKEEQGIPGLSKLDKRLMSISVGWLLRKGYHWKVSIGTYCPRGSSSRVPRPDMTNDLIRFLLMHVVNY